MGAMLWLAAVLCGMGVLLVYDFTPGRDGGGAPAHWVASSRIPRRADVPTPIMFAHPKCPCTRASIGELAMLMARCQGRVNAQVVFFRPEGSDEDWARGDLWRSAAAIPGVSVRLDENGREAGNFRATTSGDVVLYDASGNLLFAGGITDGRGYSGDNAGRDALVALLNHGQAANRVTPVFGCSLRDLNSSGGNPQDSCKR